MIGFAIFEKYKKLPKNLENIFFEKYILFFEKYILFFEKYILFFEKYILFFEKYILFFEKYILFFEKYILLFEKYILLFEKYILFFEKYIWKIGGYDPCVNVPAHCSNLGFNYHYFDRKNTSYCMWTWLWNKKRKNKMWATMVCTLKILSFPQFSMG